MQNISFLNKRYRYGEYIYKVLPGERKRAREAHYSRAGVGGSV